MIINARSWKRVEPSNNAAVEQQVRQILSDIQSKGDSTIIKYAVEFDQQKPRTIKLQHFDEYQLDAELMESIKIAAKRIEKFAHFQMQGIETKEFNDEFGTFGQVVSPIERVGAYIPGGRYPLISTALMTLIPAKVAGCPVRIACSPSDNPAILAAASLAGATRFIQIGGAQAIGALTFGFDSINPVDIIIGPGNAWVNEAKKQIQSRIKIDGLAGPSELLAICDCNQPKEWIALDALAQAEHDPLACSLVISDDANWLGLLLDYLQSKPETKILLKHKQIELIYAQSRLDLINFSENYAPEHLMLCHNGIESNQLTNYGSLFIGANSAVALGDYLLGSNHTLPTLGYARQSGGLSVSNFLKIKTVQRVNGIGRKILSNYAMPIASAEGLKFHYQSLKARKDGR